MAAAAESLTPVLLELGGKDAAIVLEDADLTRTARGLAWGGFQNAGQTCISVERIYVVETVYEAFLREFLAQVKAINTGSGPGVDMGPMVVPFQLVKVEAQLRQALEKGGRVALGGHRADPASNIFQPTVVTDVDSSADLFNEETFGPLVPVVPVKDAEEAIRRTNASRFGLSASVWSGDKARGLEVARRLQVGGVSVNDVLVHYGVPGLPFGGYRDSGFGRTRGLEGLGHLTRTRSVVVNRFRFKAEPWWFPYDRSTEVQLWSTLQFRWKTGIRGVVAALSALVRRKRG